MILPYINMHPPRVYTCSPSWTLLPPPSPYHPSGSSQCTSPKHPVLCIEPGLLIRFLYDIVQPSEWEKIIANEAMDKQLISKIYKQILQLNSRKINDTLVFRFILFIYPFESESESRSVTSDSLRPHGLYSPWNSPGQNTGVGSLSLLQGIFQTQESNQVSCIAGGFFTNWAIREAHLSI